MLHREVVETKLHSVRLFTKTNKLPKWGERFIHSNVVKIVEESILDPSKKTFVTYTRNVGFTNVMVGIRLLVFYLIFKVIHKLIYRERTNESHISTLPNMGVYKIDKKMS